MTTAAAPAKEPTHEEVFVERYDQLLRWAIRLTKRDSELAKDLVQQAFVQFTLSAGNLVDVNNIETYLYGVVRKVYLSHRRRTFRDQQWPFEIDASSNLLGAFDPRDQMKAKDALRAICHYACTRKDKSVTASVLILRFFHGYVPSEVARLTNNSRKVIDVQLRTARSEAIASLAASRIAAPAKKPAVLIADNKNSRHSDLLFELRENIFLARRGDCVHSNDLIRLYSLRKAVPRAILSHLVSCQNCLEEANRLLGLASLQERNAIDHLGWNKLSPAKTTVFMLQWWVQGLMISLWAICNMLVETLDFV